MTRLAAALGILLLVILVTWALWARLDHAETRANAAEQALREARTREAQAQSVIAELQDNAQRLEQQRQALNEQKTTLSQQASARLARIKELQRDNKTLRDWADTQLPDAIIRLRRRPAARGAGDYAESLRHPQPLPAAGQRPDHQRRTTPDP